MTPLGIIGLGRLGALLASRADLPSGSFGASKTTHATRLHSVSFDWSAPSTWTCLPKHNNATLVLTIPPVHSTLGAEIERLEFFGRWIREFRPSFTKMVYISTTGVYPAAAGVYSETSSTLEGRLDEADTNKGRLRQISEQTLSVFFDLKIIRPGAIYGPGRNILTRMIKGQPIPAGEGLVNRVHMDDLAQITFDAATQEDFPSIVNAVDPNPSSSMEVAEWLMGLPELEEAGLSIFKEEGYLSRKGFGSTESRIIQPKVLLERSYSFRFPSYKEGLSAAIEHELKNLSNSD